MKINKEQEIKEEYERDEKEKSKKKAKPKRGGKIWKSTTQERKIRNEKEFND